MPRQNEWWYQVWMRQKFEHKGIQNETTVTLPLKKSLNQLVMIRSLRESWIWRKILVGIMNHWGKNDRNHEYQDSNDSASTPEINWSFSMRLCRNKRNIWHLFSYSVMSSLFSTINWTKKFWQTFFYLSHEIKVRGQDNSFFESSRFKYTNQRHATIFFSVKKKKKTVRRSKAKEKGKKSLG